MDARSTPSMPYRSGPSLAGMNGVQFAGSTYWMPKAMNSRITVTLTATMIELTKADWLMPM